MEPASRYAAFVGRTSEPLAYDVEPGHIRRFAEAIADKNPIYYDLDAARRAGHPRIPAPPTFATALRPNDPRAELGIDYRKLLHGEQSFTFTRPLYAGDRVIVRATLTETYVKSGKSGLLEMLVVETEGRAETGQLVFTARSLAVVRP